MTDNPMQKYKDHVWAVWTHSEYPYFLLSPVKQDTLTGRYVALLYPGRMYFSEEYILDQGIPGDTGVILYDTLKNLRQQRADAIEEVKEEHDRIAVDIILGCVGHPIQTASQFVNEQMEKIHKTNSREKEIVALARQMFMSNGGTVEDWEYCAVKQNYIQFARTAFDALKPKE